MNRDREAEFVQWLNETHDEFSRNQSALYVKWDLEGCKRWELHPEAGGMAFGRDDGSFVVADIQIIGSYVRSDGIWEWAWNHAELDDALKVDALAMRQHGLKRGYEALTEGRFEADAMLVGGLVAVTVKRTGSQGVWEGVDGGVSVMIAMRNVRAVDELPWGYA